MGETCTILRWKIREELDLKEEKLELFNIITVTLVIEILYKDLKIVIQFLAHQTDVLP